MAEPTWDELPGSANAWLRIPLQGLARIKLPGGVVGKLCGVLAILAFSGAAISWSVRSETVAIVVILAVCTAVLVIGVGLILFAAKHPQAALMEGAEFLAHERLALAIKGQPEIPVIPADLAPEPGSSLPSQNLPLLDKPDEEASRD